MIVTCQCHPLPLSLHLHHQIHHLPSPLLQIPHRQTILRFHSKTRESFSPSSSSVSSSSLSSDSPISFCKSSAVTSMSISSSTHPILISDSIASCTVSVSCPSGRISCSCSNSSFVLSANLAEKYLLFLIMLYPWISFPPLCAKCPRLSIFFIFAWSFKRPLFLSRPEFFRMYLPWLNLSWYYHQYLNLKKLCWNLTTKATFVLGHSSWLLLLHVVL